MIASSFGGAESAAEAGFPVLFVAAGPLAQSALRQLQEVAEELRADVDGRFGFLHLGPLHAPVSVAGVPVVPLDHSSIHTWVAEKIPAKLPLRAAHSENTDLRSAAIRLLRRLTLLQSVPSFHPQSTPIVKVYVAADLSNAAQLERAIEAIRHICSETYQIDITWVLLTGRSAQYDANQELGWRAGYLRLSKAVKEDAAHHRCLLHRAYFCDGRDSRLRWLESSSDVSRKAAEFLFHHALASYRDELRRFEASRPSPESHMWPVLGSFICHSLVSDQAAIGQETAQELLRRSSDTESEDLPTENDKRLVEEAIESLCKRLTMILARQRATSAVGSDAAILPENGGGEALREATVSQQVYEALHEAICDLCREGNPLARLKYFSSRLRTELYAIRLSANVAERRFERFQVSQQLRGQLDLDLLDPQQWLPRSEDQALAPVESHAPALPSRQRRAEPKRKSNRRSGETTERPRPRRWVLEQPLPIWRLVLGIALALAGIVSFFWLPPGGAIPFAYLAAWLAILGGVLAIDLPSEQFAIAETIVDPEQPMAPPVCEYRLLPWQTQVVLGVMIALAGALFVGFQLRWGGNAPPLWQWIAALLVMTASAAAILGYRPSSFEELSADFEGHKYATDYPSSYPIVAMMGWIGVYAVATFVLILWNLQVERVFFPFAPALGMLAVAAGMILAAWPNWSRRRFQQSLPSPVLSPLHPIYGSPRRAAALDSSLERVIRWVDSLTAESVPPKRANRLNMLTPFPRNTFLDAIVEDWPRKVADLCEETVAAARSNPVLWADCILSGFQHDELGPQLDQLNAAFIARIVNSWLSEQVERVGWAVLLRNLKPDPHWTDRLFEQNLAPLWPHDGRDVDVDVGLAAASPELLAGEAANAVSQGRYHIVGVAWPDPRRVVLIRLVQGMTMDRYDAWLESLKKE